MGAKTYTKSTRLWSTLPPRRARAEQANNANPEVLITIDSNDTGEVREMGSYEAHRIKTKITVKPSKGASIAPSKTFIDGWYIDLPGLSCRDSLTPLQELGPGFFPTLRTNRVIKYKGDARRGFAVEETSKRKQSGNVIIDKTELLEFSEKPLDPSLFEPPPDFKETQFGPIGMAQSERTDQ